MFQEINHQNDQGATKNALTNQKKDHIKNTTDKEDNMQEPIGENTFLKLRQERDQARSECELVKIQRDIALRKLNKTLKCITELRMIIEDVAKKK